MPSVLAASAAGVCQACKDPRFKKKSGLWLVHSTYDTGAALHGDLVSEWAVCRDSRPRGIRAACCHDTVVSCNTSSRQLLVGWTPDMRSYVSLPALLMYVVYI